MAYEHLPVCLPVPAPALLACAQPPGCLARPTRLTLPACLYSLLVTSA